MSKDFWMGKKVLVTGGRGFLGSSLVPKLEKEDAVPFLFGSKEYDLRKEGEVEKLFRDSNPDMVIHLAVDGGGIGYLRKNPGSSFYNNLMMNTLLQEQARKRGVEKFVGVGSVCAYPKFTEVPFKEEDLWLGYPEETNAPYGLSKKMMMVQSQAYQEQYGFNANHLLMVNLYGPNDDFDLENSHVIPALIRKFESAVRQGTDVEIWGTGSASREFLYVDDAAEAIILAAENYDNSDPVNIGSGQETTIKGLVKKISRLMNFKGDIIWDKTKPDGQPRRCLDISKARERFGFEAKTSLEEGLKNTVKWYLSQ